MKDEAFKEWWYSEGSQAPYKHHDCEEHTMRMCEIAWANGAYKEREEANARAQPEQEPVAWQWLDTAHFRKKLPKDAGDGVWNPLYAAPQRTERPVDCERCNRLEEQAYDLVGKLRVANIKLSMLLPRTWAGLEKSDMPDGADPLFDDPKFIAGMVYAANKLKEKNNG